LQQTELPAARGLRPTRRRTWLAASAAALAVAVTGVLVGLGGSSPAYAVTRNADGTVTVAVTRMAGVPGANAELRTLGLRVVVVPVQSGCPALSSLPAPAVPPSGPITTEETSTDGSVTVNAQGIPVGDLLVLAISSTPSGTSTAAMLTSPPAPSCVSVSDWLSDPAQGIVPDAGSARHSLTDLPIAFAPWFRVNPGPRGVSLRTLAVAAPESSAGLHGEGVSRRLGTRRVLKAM
jgi:hypothetical protein